MASSTADTTIWGSIPFSRLIVSITLYSSLAIVFCHLALGFYNFSVPMSARLWQMWGLSDFRNQIRLFDIGDLDLDFPGRSRLPLLRLAVRLAQVQGEASVLKFLQTSFEMPVTLDRVVRAQLQ